MLLIHVAMLISIDMVFILCVCISFMNDLDPFSGNRILLQQVYMLLFHCKYFCNGQKDLCIRTLRFRTDKTLLTFGLGTVNKSQHKPREIRNDSPFPSSNGSYVFLLFGPTCWTLVVSSRFYRRYGALSSISFPEQHHPPIILLSTKRREAAS
jgi:hypothetical protein